MSVVWKGPAVTGKNATTLPNKVFLGIGANLVPDGYASAHDGCGAAVDMLTAQDIEVLACSRWFESAPVPISDQPFFVNAVVLAQTKLSPAETLARLHEIENRFGRTRMVRNEARVLDIDLLNYADMVHDDAALMLPHPRLHERAFVLLPLFDVAPDWIHPALGTPLHVMIANLPDDQMIRPLGAPSA